MKPWVRRWRNNWQKVRKSSLELVVKGLEPSQKVLQGETALGKETAQVGPVLEPHLSNKHEWSMFCGLTQG